MLPEELPASNRRNASCESLCVDSRESRRRSVGLIPRIDFSPDRLKAVQWRKIHSTRSDKIRTGKCSAVDCKRALLMGQHRHYRMRATRGECAGFKNHSWPYLAGSKIVEPGERTVPQQF